MFVDSIISVASGMVAGVASSLIAMKVSSLVTSERRHKEATLRLDIHLNTIFRAAYFIHLDLWFGNYGRIITQVDQALDAIDRGASELLGDDYRREGEWKLIITIFNNLQRKFERAKNTTVGFSG